MSASIDTPAPAPAAAVASERTNVLAIVAFVLSFVVTVGGIVCGHVALRQIKRTGEQGRGLALAATVLGYVFTAFWAVALVAIVPILVIAGLSAVDGGY